MVDLDHHLMPKLSQLDPCLQDPSKNHQWDIPCTIIHVDHLKSVFVTSVRTVVCQSEAVHVEDQQNCVSWLHGQWR